MIADIPLDRCSAGGLCMHSEPQGMLVFHTFHNKYLSLQKVAFPFVLSSNLSWTKILSFSSAPQSVL